MGLKKVAELQDRLKVAMEHTTATELAAKIGLSKQAISAYTTGVRIPKQPVISAIAEALRLNPAWLMGYDVPKTIQDGVSNKFFAEKIKGRSMEPRIYDGDIAIVHKQDDVESGDIAVVKVAGVRTTKKVVKQETGVILVGLNATVYTPEFYSYGEVEILGKVVEVRGKMDGWDK